MNLGCRTRLLSILCLLPMLLAAPPAYAADAALPEITCWGDSLTQNGIAVALANLYAGVRKVNNQGVGGEPSTAIAVRQGGTPLTVSFPGNSMPASGSVTVTAKTVNGDPKIRHAVKGSIGGIEGVLSRNISTGAYTWNRKTPGQVAAVPADAVMVVDTDHAEAHTVVLWYGRNNVNTDDTAEYVKEDLRRSIAHLEGKHQRFIVMGVTRSAYASEYAGTSRSKRINALDQWMKEQWPDHYLETMDYLLAAHDPNNAEDAADAGNGVIPSSLRRPGDKTHLNAAGDKVLAEAIKKWIDKNGW